MSRQVWYHANCWDGFGAAWAFHKLMGSATFVPVNYGQSPPKHAAEDNVYILDFSYSSDVMVALKSSVAKLTVIDHHESARDAVLSVGGVFDQSQSGATLTWEVLGAPDNPPMPRLLSYVQDRDLWSWKMPESRTLQWLIRSLRPDFAAWDEMAALFEKESAHELAKRAKHIKDFVDVQIASEMRNAWPEEVAGHRCMVLNATLLTSDICDAIIQDGAAVAGYFTVGKDGRRRWGFRSKHGEALEICQAMGGGGHANAAGYDDDDNVIVVEGDKTPYDGGWCPYCDGGETASKDGKRWCTQCGARRNLNGEDTDARS